MPRLSRIERRITTYQILQGHRIANIDVDSLIVADSPLAVGLAELDHFLSVDGVRSLFPCCVCYVGLLGIVTGAAGHALHTHNCEIVGHQSVEYYRGVASFHDLVLEPGFVLAAAVAAVIME